MNGVRLFVVLVLSSVFLTRGHVPSFDAGCGHIIQQDVAVSQSHHFITHNVDGIAINAKDEDTISTINSSDGLILQIALQGDSIHFSPGSDFSFYVGSLALRPSLLCDSSVAFPRNSSRVLPFQPKIEPFSQTVYNILIKDTISSQTQTAKYYVVMLKSLKGKTIKWSAVVGKAETFSALDLVSFPISLWKLHGVYSNNRNRLPVLWLILLVYCIWRLMSDESMIQKWRNANRVYRSAGIAALCYTLVIIDIVLQYIDSTQQVSNSSVLHSIPLFTLIVLLLANVLPLSICCFFMNSSRVELADTYPQTQFTPFNCLKLILLYLVYNIALFGIADQFFRYIISSGVIMTSLAFGFGVYTSRCCIWHIHVAILSMSVVLLFFIGSGYWFGPIFLCLASILQLSSPSSYPDLNSSVDVLMC